MSEHESKFDSLTMWLEEAIQFSHSTVLVEKPQCVSAGSHENWTQYMANLTCTVYSGDGSAKAGELRHKRVCILSSLVNWWPQ